MTKLDGIQPGCAVDVGWRCIHDVLIVIVLAAVLASCHLENEIRYPLQCLQGGEEELCGKLL